jgi:ferredoxin-nitrate reductase
VDADPGPPAGAEPAPAGRGRPPPHPTAREADLHLAIRPGTNLALLNGLLRELIAHGWLDRAFVDAHTVGFDQLAQTVRPYDPERVADICGVPAGQVREAARILGTAERLLSTVLQGVYQATGATAAACQVNNPNLVRGMIGRPGCGVLQMNGQPTAQNTRETGADGDLPGFRNWDNEAHVRELAELWNVDPIVIPHWAPPTHAMQIWRYAEQGSIGLLWISATNPAVSLPELPRIRSILGSEDLFVVVQDAFLTETARLADVVLPTAIWGEKTGTFTNADRTVHLSERAVDPPGQARSDLDIFLDYAARMDFRDRDGRPLIGWHDPEGAFEAWKACSKGRPCDYSGLSYERLRDAGASSGPATPSTPTAPNAPTPT